MVVITSLQRFWHKINQWTWHHGLVFILTFFSYASFHACRKSFSNIKYTWEKSYTPKNIPYGIYPYELWQSKKLFYTESEANEFLGQLDFLFLIAYAIGLFFSGIIGDRVNLRYMLSFGMCSSAVVTFLFGYLSEEINMENLYYYRCLNFVNGLCQSTGFPAVVAIMGNWFSKSSGGLVFGFWSANASVGNIIGSVIVAAVLDYGYEIGMLLNSILLFCFGVIVFFCLIVHPNDVGLENPDLLETREAKNIESTDSMEIDEVKPKNTIDIKKSKAITFTQALRIPGVIPYSLAYACLKLVSYSFFFWLPTYLDQGLGWNDKISDELSNFFDIGAVLGGIIAGILTDLMRIRSPIVASMLFLSMGSVYIFANTGTSYLLNLTFMFLSGFLLGGPSNMISTTITADLGKHEKLQGSSEALATVTGIIDGTGSIGAAIGQYLVGVVSHYWSWSAVFYVLIFSTFLSIICIIPMLIKDFKLLKHRRLGNYKMLPIESDLIADDEV